MVTEHYPNLSLPYLTSVLGVNTGFGGSANTRTDQVNTLQVALMQLTQAGIIGKGEGGMPIPYVRGALVIRCNTNLRGHSAVTMKTIEALNNLLKHNITPVVPLQGSISASGDLMPLSYCVGAIQGNPDINVFTNTGVVPSDVALKAYKLEPVKLGPKEGLGLINGTAFSAALGAQVIYDAHHLALLAQLLTAVAVEVCFNRLFLYL
jgi:phenylalanine ammonia-lyase